jgi:uncharacterized protein (DUF305 family)
MRARTLLVALAVAVPLGAGACSSDDSTVAAPEGEVSEAPHNDADISFVQGMIPHHEQAVEMASLAADRAEDPRVLDLASRIEAAQGPEIEQMTALLSSWGEEPSAAEHDMDMGSGSGSGMMSEDDMAALEAASGGEFDQMFLSMMVEHHEGAVAMAETEIADGENPEAIALAEAIVAAQEGEIEEMTGILAELG